MIINLQYTLPDELELYKAALQAKFEHYQPVCPIERNALNELHAAITAYMLQPVDQHLSNLNRILNKYSNCK